MQAAVARALREKICGRRNNFVITGEELLLSPSSSNSQVRSIPESDHSEKIIAVSIGLNDCVVCQDFFLLVAAGLFPAKRHALFSAGLVASSATVIFSHTTPATSSSSSQPNSIFLSHHSSSSLQLQPAEHSECKASYLPLEGTCMYIPHPHGICMTKRWMMT